MKKNNLRTTTPEPAASGSLALREPVPVLAMPEIPPDDFSLRDIVAVFRAHLPLFLGTLLLVLGLGFVIALMTPPSYESTAVINLEDRTSFVETDKMLGGEIPGLSRDSSILESLPLAIRVLKRLRAEQRLPAAVEPTGHTIDSIPARQIRQFRKRLRVEHTPGSSVYAITYKDTDPENAARVVNIVVEEFRKMKSELLGQRYEIVRRSINQEAERLRAEVRKAEEKVAEYKKANGLSDSIGISLKIRQIGDLNAELRQVRSDLRDAETLWKQVSSLSRAGNVAAVATILESPLIHSLRDRQASLKAKIRELEQEYGKRHPIMADARAQLKEVDDNIRREIALLVGNVGNDVKSLRTKAATLKSDIARLEREVLVGQEALVRLKDLERDAESSRRVLEKFLLAEKQHSMSARNQIALSNPITVISKGFVPVESVFPNGRHIMVLSALAAPILATMLVFFAEHLNPRVRRCKLQALAAAAEAESSQRAVDDAGASDPAGDGADVRFIGGGPVPNDAGDPVIPIPGDGSTIVPATEMLGKMQSRFSQAIARLNDRLRARLGDREPTVTVVTSVGNAGDKVSVAAALAALNAAEGKKVILVDLSLGEAELHRAFALEPTPGMTEVMRKKLSLLKAFQTDFRTHVSLFTRGAPVSGDEARKLLDAAPALMSLLKRYFDQIYVVVRNINHNHGEDSQLFADYADQILLVVEQNRGDHVKLTSMLLRSSLRPVRERTLPVYVERQGIAG